MEVVGIRFKNNMKTYYFAPNGLKLGIDNKVIVETPNGNTMAKVVEANKEINAEALVAPLSNVVRVATESDIKTMEQLESRRNEVLETTKSLIVKHKLDMKLVDCEFTLDGQKIIITYVCEDRVDFRELVKELASKLKSRIELKQIGIRDRAKVVGGIGACGEVCCCSRYLNNFDKVSIKMAKTQSLSLNPTKISGVCGRLMCCLSYENEVYADAQKLMPRVSSKVKTPDGNGTVLYNNLLKKTCDVRIDGDDVVVKNYALKDIIFDGKIESDDSLPETNFVMEDAGMLNKQCQNCSRCADAKNETTIIESDNLQNKQVKLENNNNSEVSQPEKLSNNPPNQAVQSAENSQNKKNKKFKRYFKKK